MKPSFVYPPVSEVTRNLCAGESRISPSIGKKAAAWMSLPVATSILKITPFPGEPTKLRALRSEVVVEEKAPQWMVLQKVL